MAKQEISEDRGVVEDSPSSRHNIKSRAPSEQWKLVSDRTLTASLPTVTRHWGFSPAEWESLVV